MPLFKILSPVYYRGLSPSNGAEKKSSFLANFCPMVWCRFLTTKIFDDHYRTLELKSTATPAEIKEAYYRLSKIFHPDVYKQDKNSDKFKSISAAYEVLGDPEKKAQYDMRRQVKSFSSNYSSSSPSSAYRYPGNAEYYGGPRRNPRTYAEPSHEDYDWVHQVNYQQQKTAPKNRKQEAGYEYFWHFFWGTLVTWVSLTGFVFFSDNNQFGAVQTDLRSELDRTSRIKELKNMDYKNAKEEPDERRTDR